jgi:hypothetical protein
MAGTWEEGRSGSNEIDYYGLGPLAIYLGLSCLFFARSLVGHLGDRYIGVGPDPSQFIWYLRWWPYALSHHLNPFEPHVIWAPSEYRLDRVDSAAEPGRVPAVQDARSNTSL